MKNILLLFATLQVCLFTSAQSLPVGTPVFEEAWRQRQLKGETDSNVSFMVRPLQGRSLAGAEGPFGRTAVFPETKTDNTTAKEQPKVYAKPLPLTIKQQYNAHHPYGWNDGSLIPAKGYQAQVSAGVFLKTGRLSVQLQPEFVFAQNAPFRSILSTQTAAFTKIYYDSFLNVVDLPERFGDRSYGKLFPGQSSIRFNFGKLSVGLSSENLWWGPGVRNSLLMSNNAPGFPHLTLNTTAPIQSPVGSFEGQVISGFLKRSGFLPDTTKAIDGEKLYIPKPNGDRYINGVILTWQPKWTKGLFVGASRLFYSYRTDVRASLDGYFPVLGKMFKSPASNEDNLNRDEMISLFARLLMQKAQAEVYAEFGRNDHSQDMRDLLMEPEHSRALLFGFKKLFTTAKGRDVELMGEFTTLQLPSTYLVREQQRWYTHYQVRDGYTNYGQVMGAGIGPGSSSQTLGLHWVKDAKRSGASLERVVHNNDLYYVVYATERNFWSHWVDYSLNLKKSWQCGKILYDARLSLVKSLNYQWRRDSDVHFFYAGVSASYLF